MDNDTPKTADEIRGILTQLRAELDALGEKARRARSRDRQCQYYAEMRVIDDSIEDWMKQLPQSKPVTLLSLRSLGL